MPYQFLDAYGSVLTADSSIVSGVIQRPIINIGSVLGPLPVQFSGNTSVSGTVGASIIGTVPVTFGTPSVSGTVGASIIGQLPTGTAMIGSVTAIQGTNPWMMTGSVQGTFFPGNQSVSGTVGASIIGSVPVTFSTPSVSGTVGASIIGLTPVAVTNIPSISGTVGASVIGLTPVAVTNTPSISGSVGLTGTPSISGAVTVVGTPGITIVGSVLTTHSPSASLISGVTSIITGTASTLVLAAAPGAQRNYISQLLITNGATTGTFVNIVDNGVVIYSGYAAASGGGFSASFNPPLKQPTSVLALYVAPTSQASIIAAASGYTAP